MKTKHLKKKKIDGETVYTCPDCGGTMFPENNQEMGELAQDYWYECVLCNATAH